MLYLVIFILLLIVIGIILIMIKINILLEYKREEWDDHLLVSLYIRKGFLKYKVEIPLIDLEKSGIKFRRVSEIGKKEKDTEKKKGMEKFAEVIERFKDIKNFYQANKDFICKIKDYLKTRLICREFKVDVIIGTGEACYTGLASGMAWAVIGNIVCFIENSYTLQKRSVTVKPVFNEYKFKVDFYCIFNIKIVHIIVIGMKFLKTRFTKKFGFKNKSIGGDICG